MSARELDPAIAGASTRWRDPFTGAGTYIDFEACTM
jgi:hypothetical protein